MYFTMVDHTENGKTYSRRVGVMTASFKAAKEKAIKKHGYVVDESNHVIAQAMSPFLPKYIGNDRGTETLNGCERSINNRVMDIGSGEDCFA